MEGALTDTVWCDMRQCEASGDESCGDNNDEDDDISRGDISEDISEETDNDLSQLHPDSSDNNEKQSSTPKRQLSR